jgi:predicted RNase H-like HicB family nuclease
MELSVVVEQEADGRWIAEVPELPGVLVYGASQAEAMAKAEVLALRVLAERIEFYESGAQPVHIRLPDAA